MRLVPVPTLPLETPPFGPRYRSARSIRSLQGRREDCLRRRVSRTLPGRWHCPGPQQVASEPTASLTGRFRLPSRRGGGVGCFAAPPRTAWPALPSSGSRGGLAFRSVRPAHQPANAGRWASDAAERSTRRGPPTVRPCPAATRSHTRTRRIGRQRDRRSPLSC